MKVLRILLLVGGVVALFIAIQKGDLFSKVMPPQPIVVSSTADASSSKLLEYSVKVKGVVRNEGGDGYVVVEATVQQGGDSWMKTERIYLSSFETKDFELIFDEARMLGENPSYYVRAYNILNQ